MRTNLISAFATIQVFYPLLKVHEASSLQVPAIAASLCCVAAESAPEGWKPVFGDALSPKVDPRQADPNHS